MKSKNERTVVTGLGTLSAAGSNMSELWESTLTGRANVKTRYVAGIDRHLPIYAIEKMPAIAPTERRLLRHADRSVLIALAAAREAWKMANLAENSVDPLRVGLIIGSSRGPAEINSLSAGRTSRMPTESLYTTFASISGVVATALRIQGCSLMISATCISGAAAMKTAMQMIQSGELDLALVGGVETPLIDSLLEQYVATQVLSLEKGPGSLRPFGRNRSGTVFGEGAAFLVLESETSALRRGVSLRGVIHHVAIGSDISARAGGDKTGEALRRTTEQGLQVMGLTPREIDLVHLHGTGTQLNDITESACVRSVFGPVEEQPLSWATKAITGHTLGAAPVFQTILTLEALRQSFIPGTTSGADQDPACSIRLSREPGIKKNLQTALCLTSGFWGNTSCIGLGSALAAAD